jgi:hypothetical protein
MNFLVAIIRIRFPKAIQKFLPFSGMATLDSYSVHRISQDGHHRISVMTCLQETAFSIKPTGCKCHGKADVSKEM